MKLAKSLLVNAVGLALPFSVQATDSEHFEGDFRPSPDGQHVVSVVHDTHYIPRGIEPIETDAFVTLKIRDSKGKDLFSVSIAEARRWADIGNGFVRTAWSSDSQTLAYCYKGKLSVIGVGDRKPHRLLDSTSSFRWVDNSNLLCVTEPLEGNSSFSVTEISTRDGTARTQLQNQPARAFEGWFSSHYNQLSPDLKHVVFVNNTNVLIMRLLDTNSQKAIQRELTPQYCWWDDAGSQCLVHGFEGPPSSYRDVIYLYETKDAAFTELTENLQHLHNNTNNFHFQPWKEDRVWSSDGTWFLISSALNDSNNQSFLGDLICVPDTWRCVCIQEVLGKDFYDPLIAPSGNKLGIIRAPTVRSSGDLYTVEIRAGTNGTPTFGKPQKIASDVPQILFGDRLWCSWFWSADGKQLVVWNGRKFIYYQASGNQ